MTKEDLQSYQVLKREVTYLYKRCNNLPWTDRELGERAALWQEAMDRANEALLAIETALSQLKPEERQVLRLRYIDGLSWTQVCLRAHYSRTQAFRIHASALKRLAK